MTAGEHLFELDHPVAHHHLAAIRSVDTSAAAFRCHISVLTTLLAVEATRHLPLKPASVQTPLETVTGSKLQGLTAIVPILRAGLGMVDPLLNLLPDAVVWHLGMYRDEETATPVSYYDGIPEGGNADVAFVTDPMLATGGSAAFALRALREKGIEHVTLLSVIAAPEGIALLRQEFPDVRIGVCVIDRQLNDQKYILPGLGDAGDRIFNT